MYRDAEIDFFISTQQKILFHSQVEYFFLQKVQNFQSWY